MVKNAPHNAGDVDSIPGLGRCPREMATHSSIPVWESPWQSLVGFSSRGHKRVRHDLVTNQQKKAAAVNHSNLMHSIRDIEYNSVQ